MTLKELYNKVTEILEKAGVDSPAFEATWLINAEIPCDRLRLISEGDTPVSKEAEDKIFVLAERRAEGEPLQYIIGEWEFFGNKYYVGEGVLIPRDDTEVALTSTFPYLDSIKDREDLKILDLCSGSGILAISLKLRYKNAQVTAVEISDLALPYLQKNAKENKADIRIIHDDIFNCAEDFSDGEFDLIISNPPYVTDEDMETLQREVRYEPSLALAGGVDGLTFYRRIIPLYTRKLKQGGMLCFEYDAQQAESISAMMNDAGFVNIQVFDDIGGVHRAINGTLQKN
ncbi:MAG: peptide chain release factor N(5)-glutamine methyltransferase [Ruminococcaceae bacterium]|nr:peptide chain release factor N(5)-glutamine methyltransferase [Oscillospiraceae bacterium]